MAPSIRVNALDGLAEPRRRAIVVTVSDSVAGGSREDRSGPEALRLLEAQGLEVEGPLVVPDERPRIAALLREAAGRADLVVTTGGTGLAPTDGTPEATRAVLDREVPGIAEAVRARGVANGIPTAMLSRGVAGLAGRTLVVNLPGSTGGVRDALAVLADVLPHALDQARGGDH